MVDGPDVALSEVVADGATSTTPMSFELTMDNTASDACQGAVFTVTLGVTGFSN